MSRELGNSSQVTRRRYDRIAPVYDAIEWVVEWAFFRRWRRELWQEVPPGRILEVGVGTGKNLEFHLDHHDVVGIDLSPRMLSQARARAARFELDVDLREADAQELPFSDAAFDAVVASFVFCSVPDPARGLREARRVLKPGGTLVLLEHVVSHRRWLARLMSGLDSLALHIWGAHIDRDTAENVVAAGFEGVQVRYMLGDVVVVVTGNRGEAIKAGEEPGSRSAR